jgi:hypothetical protein
MLRICVAANIVLNNHAHDVKFNIIYLNIAAGDSKITGVNLRPGVRQSISSKPFYNLKIPADVITEE